MITILRSGILDSVDYRSFVKRIGPSRRSAIRAGIAGMAIGCLALTGCTTDSGDTDGEVSVLAAFYPLQFAAERVGGDAVTVDSLTPPGAEPHDVELTPQQVAEVAEADLVVYIKGFQPAVDEAVAAQASDRAIDVSADVPLRDSDPHVWLDPTNMVVIADAIADRLATIDPEAAAGFRANAESLDADLQLLDGEWRDGTAECSSRDLVVSHEAFGYLADRYDLTQVGISGLSPESEPTPGQLAEITDFVRANDVRTIYYETLVDPKVAETVAAETGAQTAVLDPLEGLAEGSSDDYLSVMRTNLDTVKSGQPCP